jgi:hypothetical protein
MGSKSKCQSYRRGNDKNEKSFRHSEYKCNTDNRELIGTGAQWNAGNKLRHGHSPSLGEGWLRH